MNAEMGRRLNDVRRHQREHQQFAGRLADLTPDQLIAMLTTATLWQATLVRVELRQRGINPHAGKTFRVTCTDCHHVGTVQGRLDTVCPVCCCPAVFVEQL
jgi:hypothetical protein